MATLIEAQGRGDVIKQYGISKRDGIDFNLASIPQKFDVESKEPFDKAYMNALFSLAYSQAKNGYPWQKQPPDF